jgi:hypothetical protein
MRGLRPICVLTVVALLLGTVAAAVDARKPPRPRGGAWSGPTSQGFRIDFRVSRGKKRKTVVPITADFKLRCSDGSTIERNVKTKDRTPVVGRKFGIVVTLVANKLITGGKARFVGTFRSKRRARGRASEQLKLRDGRTCKSKRVRWKARFRHRR